MGGVGIFGVGGASVCVGGEGRTVGLCGGGMLKVAECSP